MHGKTDRRVSMIRGSSAGPVLPPTRRQGVCMLCVPESRWLVYQICMRRGTRRVYRT